MAVGTLDDAVLDWFGKMHELGVIPQESRRVIIDIPLRGVVKVYCEYNGDPRMFTIEMADMLKDADLIGVMDSTHGAVQPTRPFPPPPPRKTPGRNPPEPDMDGELPGATETPEQRDKIAAIVAEVAEACGLRLDVLVLRSELGGQFVLTCSDTLSEAAKRQITEAWKRAYEGTKNAHKSVLGPPPKIPGRNPPELRDSRPVPPPPPPPPNETITKGDKP